VIERWHLLADLPLYPAVGRPTNDGMRTTLCTGLLEGQSRGKAESLPPPFQRVRKCLQENPQRLMSGFGPLTPGKPLMEGFQKASIDTTGKTAKLAAVTVQPQ
jgi:hypothetical protein